MYQNMNWAVVIPMANEEPDFKSFIEALTGQLNHLDSGHVYFIVDRVSTDRTLELCKLLSSKDSRFTTVWAPENRNVVDAYLRGYKEALNSGHAYILEMDAGLSHDPKALGDFLRHLLNGFDCAFGSRFIKGGSMGDSPFKRRFLSKAGTLLSNLLLGTSLKDMTSGYQGFTREVVASFTRYSLKSKAHFYQTELRYLLRKRKSVEIPIIYKAPSPRVSDASIYNSISVLLYYFFMRITFRAVAL